MTSLNNSNNSHGLAQLFIFHSSLTSPRITHSSLLFIALLHFLLLIPHTDEKY